MKYEINKVLIPTRSPGFEQGEIGVNTPKYLCCEFVIQAKSYFGMRKRNSSRVNNS